MENYSSRNNNNASDLTGSERQHLFQQSKIVNTCRDELSYSPDHSQTLKIIRSIVDELYQINNQKSLSKEKRVRFTLEEEANKTKSGIIYDSKLTQTSIRCQPVLSESSTFVGCLIKGRSKVDCSVSTNDHPSLQCECATQTMDITVFPKYNHSLLSLLTNSNDLHRSRSDTTLSTASISSKSTILHYPSSLSISNHLLYSCENNTIVPPLSTAHQLIIPSEAKQDSICQEQTLENYNTFINRNMNSCNSSAKSNKKFVDENITYETNMKFCICSKRKLSDNHFSMNTFAFTNQCRLLEELHLSKRSLQSMSNDGLFYVHDLVLVFLRNISQFYQILVKHYYVSKKQANLYVKIMQQWWKKHQKEFFNINEKLSTNNIIK